MSDTHTPATNATEGTVHRAGAFDIRTFIAMLIGIYGLVLVVTGLVATTDQDLTRAAGLNINLWAGIGMIVVAVLFQVWATMRPVVVAEPADTTREGDTAPPRHG